MCIDCVQLHTIYGVIYMFYDRQKAVDYAVKWALDRNPAYYNYDKIRRRLH